MTVDAILLDDDKNNDGFIDYSEFATSQTRAANNQQHQQPSHRQSLCGVLARNALFIRRMFFNVSFIDFVHFGFTAEEKFDESL